MDGAKKTEFLERTRLTPVCLLALLAFNRVLTMSALLSLLATSGCNSIDTQDERGDSEGRLDWTASVVICQVSHNTCLSMSGE